MLKTRRPRVNGSARRRSTYAPWRLRALQAGTAVFAGLLFLSLIGLVLR